MARQVIWALETVAGRQDTAGGSRLVNLFALNTQNPRMARAPIILLGTPGCRPYLDIPLLNHNFELNYTSGVQGMIAVDSPEYGQRLFGIANAMQFFEVRAPEDVALYHNPYIDGSGDPVADPSVFSASRVQDFSEFQEYEKVSPVRMAEDGQRVVFIKGDLIGMWDMSANNGAGGFVDVNTECPDLRPILPRILHKEYRVGTAVDEVLPEAFSGNPPITYSISGLPAWLNFDATTRRMHGNAPAQTQDAVTVTYKAVDTPTGSQEEGDSDTQTFPITVVPAPVQPPGTPSRPTRSATTETSITVATNASPSGGPTSRFRWRIERNRSPTESSSSYTTTAARRTFLGLSPGSWHIDVRGENDGGVSDYSETLIVTIVRTPDPDPDPPDPDPGPPDPDPGLPEIPTKPIITISFSVPGVDFYGLLWCLTVGNMDRVQFAFAKDSGFTDSLQFFEDLSSRSFTAVSPYNYIWEVDVESNGLQQGITVYARARSRRGGVWSGWSPVSTKIVT